ncbi:chromosome segregation protein SMC [Propionibacteriaceae bacterium Y2011]
MYLKSLTLRGFKSFASATTLDFEPGITCVVGPNGSGKSNVVDALAWVMGEQGAKSLRGGKMEDVIFAGTSGRAPLGRAEVVLTIDNTDGALPIEYTEVTISRTMFRNGGSEYAINGNTARLLDVQDLLSDSGIGREMHVIVGQGQLDGILQATPEGRRGFIEEAAGVLKHRKRKEKALRKLEATQTNLNRLEDLIGEIRRQLKPLGRQAAVARKAATIQADVRDAKARLFADDYVQATAALAADRADEEALTQRRREVESGLERSRRVETEAEAELAAATPRLSSAQETWYALAGLRERVATTVSIAGERVRHAAEASTEERPGRDPDELDAEAAKVAAQEAELAADVAAADDRLNTTSQTRTDAEAAHLAEEQRLAGLIRAAADRREGLARLTGQVNSLRARSVAAAEEIGRLTEARTLAGERAAKAQRDFAALETKVAGLDSGEESLDTEHEEATAELDTATAELDDLADQEQKAKAERSALAARLEALQLGLDRKDASAALLAADDRVSGLLGQVASMLQVEAGHEAAVSAALGAAADAVAVTGVDSAVRAFDFLKSEDLGRAGLLLSRDGGSAGADHDRDSWPALPAGARYAAEVVSCEPDLRSAVDRMLRKVALVPDLAAARELVGSYADVTAVTPEGDVLSSWYAAGGSTAKQSLIEVQAAVEDAESRLAEAGHTVDRLQFAKGKATERHQAAKHRVEVALARLHESDAQLAAIAEELGHLNSLATGATGEVDRLAKQITDAEQAHERDVAGLAELEERWRLANESTDDTEPDADERDRLAEVARNARSAEMDARLALRTVEERARALSGRADSLRRAAENERRARAKARARAERMRAEAETARAVGAGAGQLLARIDRSLAQAAQERTAAETNRAEYEAALAGARNASRGLAEELQGLVDSAHRDELARAQQQMRVDTLAEKVLAELGLEPGVLVAEYGPEQPVPVLVREDGTPLSEDDDPVEPVPYVRDEQAKRLRRAERGLKELGRVNPLALEEFDAMTERHAFLAEQLEDLRRTRADLMGIIADVDERVQQVFAEAYADVEVAFERVFSRLFPGGEGRLVLTEPGEWLTTGVDVEARPPGKKVKRLSLLSGGERSLVAVAFLVALFIARPSPFYILDEVEAALDDTNLGRLLELYEELRENSQLLVITHQKRTMEVADSLYGVTMRGDGVSTVISQRLADAESA